MRIFPLCFSLILGVLAVISSADQLDAALNATQRRELSKIRRQLGKVTSMLRRKKFDEAEKLIDTADRQVDKIAKDAGVDNKDKSIAGVKKLIALRRKSLLKQKGGKTAGGGVSFTKEIGPILKAKCAKCHGANNPRNGLNLTTFAGLERGGKNGPLLQVGQATQSLIIARLAAVPNLRMPKNGQPLTQKQIQTIAAWIDQGAKFDGDDKLATIGEMPTKAKPKRAPVKVTIAKATGNETVSFTKDIAPFMANLCVRCHSGNKPRSGFSLETFEKLMQGGDSGRVVLPGNLDGSRLWDLAGKQDPIKMPPGQSLITKTNWKNLRTWIEEGAKFDGGDARIALRKLVPTAEEIRAAELAKLTPEEFAQHRMKRNEELWKRVAPKERPISVESKEFFVYGNLSQAKLEAVSGWAEEHVKTLRKLFNAKEDRLWKGKLTVFVIKDRFGYEEFNLVIQKREAPREMTGHSVVTANYDEAYIVLEDVGEEVSTSSPGLRVNLIDHLTGAFMKRGGSAKLPDWVMRGTGIALAAQADPANAYVAGIREAAAEVLSGTVDKPTAIFADGTFSPSETGLVGYTLVNFMLKGGGGSKFGQFVRRLQNGDKVASALAAVYNADMKVMAQGFFASFNGKGKKR